MNSVCLQRRRDFLQLMLDVRSSAECLSVEHFDVVNHADEQACPDQETASGQENSQSSGHDSAKRVQQKRMMTEDEIVGQAFIFLLAGYETSSNTLAFTCYLLAIHQDCQERVQQEVDQFFSRHVRQTFKCCLHLHFNFRNLHSFYIGYTVCRCHVTKRVNRSHYIRLCINNIKNIYDFVR